MTLGFRLAFPQQPSFRALGWQSLSDAPRAADEDWGHCRQAAPGSVPGAPFRPAAAEPPATGSHDAPHGELPAWQALPAVGLCGHFLLYPCPGHGTGAAVMVPERQQGPRPPARPPWFSCGACAPWVGGAASCPLLLPPHCLFRGGRHESPLALAQAPRKTSPRAIRASPQVHPPGTPLVPSSRSPWTEASVRSGGRVSAAGRQPACSPRPVGCTPCAGNGRICTVSGRRGSPTPQIQAPPRLVPPLEPAARR